MKQPNLFRGSGLTAELRAQFDAFWAAYPARRPNPRALAEAAFAKAVAAGFAPAELVAAAQGYAAECKRKGLAEDFIVHARTFLSQRRFEDYIAPPETAPIGASRGERASGTTAEAEPDHPLWPLLRGTMPLAEFRTWIAKLTVLTWSEGESALLTAPTRFVRDWVRQHHAVQLRTALRVKTLHIDLSEDVHP